MLPEKVAGVSTLSKSRYVFHLDQKNFYTYKTTTGEKKQKNHHHHMPPTTTSFSTPLSAPHLPPPSASTVAAKGDRMSRERVENEPQDNNKDVHFDLVCKTSRWKDSNTPGKKVPKKVLHYFLIIPRLQRLYKSSYTAKEMTWHATGKCMEPGKMQHQVDGRAWNNCDTNQAYSMWPVILTTYNLPLWLCMKESSFMLTLLILGPKSLGKDIDVYLRPLIDDLKVLWELKGVKTIDVATGQKFNMRAMVLWTINDFPARNTAKERQDLKRLDVRSGLWLGQTKKEKCSKPQAAYSFTPKNKKVFLRLVIRFDAQELKKVIWYVLHNSPEIDTYRSQFKRQRHPKTQFGWKESRQAAYRPGNLKPQGDAFVLPSWQKVLAEQKATIVTKIGMSTDVARRHDSDGGGDDCPPTHHKPTGAGVASLTEVRIFGLL
nr:hypothetical protein [Tanacetum cinerariifolium]